MATKIGTFVLMKIGTALLVGESSSSITSAANMIETSSKINGRESTFEYGRMNRTISVSSVASTDSTLTTYGYKSALEAQIAGTKISFSITEYADQTGAAAVGDATIISGTALISNVSIENPDDDKLTFSLDLQVDGAIAITANV